MERAPVFSGLPIAFAASLGILFLGLLIFLIYVILRYEPVVSRIFDKPPMLLPLREPAEPDGEPVRFAAQDGIELAGTYWKTRADRRLGVLVFCHEYLGDRQSASSYADFVRDLGFDLFAFDFRNHGDSGVEKAYRPRQWVTDRETADLTAALEYLRTRGDADPEGVSLFGVSRGGSAALCVAASNPLVRSVVTDGAFPTKGTMQSYIDRWAEIYVGQKLWYPWIPAWVFVLLGRSSLWRTSRRWGCRFPDVEAAVKRLSPRPWLMIHGEKDAYIGLDIVQKLFEKAGDPKELWIVPEAKHNRCREMEPEIYRSRIGGFLLESSAGRRGSPIESRPPALAVAPSPSALEPNPNPNPNPVAASSSASESNGVNALPAVEVSSSAIVEGMTLGG